MPKFFIFGYARSGTTLLARLVRLHPDVHCNWQAHFFSRPPLVSSILADKKYESWLSRRSNRWNRGRDLSPVALRAMCDYILERDAAKEGKTIVGDKSPNVLLSGAAVKEAHRLYPDASIIYVVRDGRDTVLSHRFQNFVDGAQFLSQKDLALRQAFIQSPELFRGGRRSVFTEKALQRMAANWADNILETDRLGHQLYGDRYFSLRYEDLIARPFDMMSKVWNFLGVNSDGLEARLELEINQNPDAEWQGEKEPTIASELKKGQQGGWKDFFTDLDKKIFKEKAGGVLVNWGYEQGQNW